MNYNKENFPININELIQKCEKTIITINERFAKKDCLVIKDLYVENTSQRSIDFLDKLQVSINTDENDSVKNEVKGLYIFGEQNEKGEIKPIYIGISRTVFRRLRQHVWGNKHNEATLAYLKAKKRIDHNKGRLELAPEKLKEEQEEIKKYHLIVIPETNYYDMYFMEVYIAGRLKTLWNSFKTH